VTVTILQERYQDVIRGMRRSLRRQQLRDIDAALREYALGRGEWERIFGRSGAVELKAVVDGLLDDRARLIAELEADG
jgi:hypothetical protein